MSKIPGKCFENNHLVFPELLPFLKTLTLQPQVSNIFTALVCSSIDNLAMLFGHSMYIET